MEAAVCLAHRAGVGQCSAKRLVCLIHPPNVVLGAAVRTGAAARGQWERAALPDRLRVNTIAPVV